MKSTILVLALVALAVFLGFGAAQENNTTATTALATNGAVSLPGPNTITDKQITDGYNVNYDALKIKMHQERYGMNVYGLEIANKRAFVGNAWLDQWQIEYNQDCLNYNNDTAGVHIDHNNDYTQGVLGQVKASSNGGANWNANNRAAAVRDNSLKMGSGEGGR